MKFQDKFYDIIGHNKCPSSEKSAEKCILRKSYFHRILPKYRFLLKWCEPGFCSASVSKYCFSPSDGVRWNFLSFYVAKTVSVLVFSIDNSAGQRLVPGAGTGEANCEHSSNASEDENIFIKLFIILQKKLAGKKC